MIRYPNISWLNHFFTVTKIWYIMKPIEEENFAHYYDLTGSILRQEIMEKNIFVLKEQKHSINQSSSYYSTKVIAHYFSCILLLTLKCRKNFFHSKSRFYVTASFNLLTFCLYVWLRESFFSRFLCVKKCWRYLNVSEYISFSFSFTSSSKQFWNCIAKHNMM